MFDASEKFNRFAITGELNNGNSDLSSKRRFGVGCIALLESFSERTTSHGLPHVYHARGPVKKVWWAVVTAGAIAGLIYNLFQLTSNYTGYPVNVNIDIVHQPELVFPSVTICNMSPAKRSLWQQRYDSWQANTAATTNRRKKRGAGFSSYTTGSSTTDSCCCNCCFQSEHAGEESACKCGSAGGFPYDSSACLIPNDNSGTINDDLTTSVLHESTQQFVITEAVKTSLLRESSGQFGSTTYRQTSTTDSQHISTLSQTLMTTYANNDMISQQFLVEQLAVMSMQERISLGFRIDELILDCRFAGSQCGPSNFSPFVNEILGNCYIFNSGWNSSQLLVSSRTGPRFGLQLILNVNQDEYISAGDDAAGMRVVVHEPLRMPFPEDEGLAINPGQTTSIGMQRVNITRKSAPFGDCQDAVETDATSNMYQILYPNIVYSTLACMRTCYQNNVIQACGCGDPSYPLSDLAFGSNVTHEPCSYSNDIELNCMANISSLYNENQLNCSCPDACSEMAYNTEISVGLWPSLIQKDDVISKLRHQVNFTLDDTALQNNLCKVQIFYEQFDYESVEESEAYPFTQFLSDSGGVLGLWLGMSLLTVFEILEFLTDVAVLGVADIYVSAAQSRQKRRCRVQPLQNELAVG